MNRRHVIACALLAVLAACDWSAQRMVDQDRCERDEPTRYFPDGNCNQLPPEGTVRWRGVGAAAGDETLAPPVPTRRLLERGQNRFEVFCAPCHGLVGDGHSQVAENMLLRPPPSLHEPRVVAIDDAKLFAVVTAGYGLMPAYRAQLSAPDRWAVIAYLRVLQRSQDAALAQLPPEVQKEASRWLR